MAELEKMSSKSKNSFTEITYEGIYGPYTITRTDQIEVQRYRLAVLLCGISFCLGLSQWILIGPTWAWLWLLLMSIGLGLALRWIHIYIGVLHKTLQILWGLGCIGLIVLLFSVGASQIMSSLAIRPQWTLVIGPIFAALTGLGFKEFFCFRRPEAIGVTLIVPLALLGHLSQILNGSIVMTLLSLSAILLLIMSLRKFGMEVGADVGDKSVFGYLNNQEAANTL